MLAEKKDYAIKSSFYQNCTLCPRACGVDRTRKDGGSPGFCAERDQLRVAFVGPHFGEEPPISGQRGSGTIFFTGCPLRCVYCQNHQISRQGLGETVSVKNLEQRIKMMIRVHRVHNINMVTPDHFFPHVLELVSLLGHEPWDLPVVLNVSGYQSLDMLKEAEQWAHIYLPDFKYADAALAKALSRAPDYPMVALNAIDEMIRQKGFLDVTLSGDTLARKGVLVRHLILPGKIQNSLDALTTLFVEFGAHLPVSLMSQYWPVRTQKDEALNRSLKEYEFNEVYGHALDLGFQHLYVQFPEMEEHRASRQGFLPDFRRNLPFTGSD